MMPVALAPCDALVRDPKPVEIGLDPRHQLQVGIAAGGVEGDERFENLGGLVQAAHAYPWLKPTATAVCDPLCGSTPIITTATTCPFPGFTPEGTAAGMPYYGSVIITPLTSHAAARPGKPPSAGEG